MQVEDISSKRYILCKGTHGKQTNPQQASCTDVVAGDRLLPGGRGQPVDEGFTFGDVGFLRGVDQSLPDRS